MAIDPGLTYFPNPGPCSFLLCPCFVTASRPFGDPPRTFFRGFPHSEVLLQQAPHFIFLNFLLFWETEKRKEKKKEGNDKIHTTMTMTMTHSEKSHIHRMKAWPYRQGVSGLWLHKKESVLLVELARWQGAQVQTVKRQNVVQRYLK